MQAKYRVLIVLLVFLSLLNPLESFAGNMTSDPLTGGLPNINDLFRNGDLSKNITKYRNNYSLDIVEFKIYKEPIGIVNILAEFLFVVQKALSYLLIIIFYYSFELDFFELFRELVETLIGELQVAVFDELMIVAIVLIGAFYIIKIMLNQRTQIWIAIVQTIVVVAIAYAFFNNPAAPFQQIDKASKEISKSVLTGTYRASNKGTPEMAVTAAANEIWNMFVHRPWQILEFGSEEVALKYEDEILSLHPDSEERKDLVEKLSKEANIFTVSIGLKRLGFIILYLIPLIIQFLGMLVLCLLMLGYQALLIILAVVGVFVLLISLIPFFGIKVLGNWGTKILSCSATKVAITFMLALLLAFNSAIFKLANTYGWFLVLIFQLIIIAVAIWKRKMFIEIFTIIRTSPQGGLNKNRLNKDYSIERKMFNQTRSKDFRKNISRELGEGQDHIEYEGNNKEGYKVIAPASIDENEIIYTDGYTSSQKPSISSNRKDDETTIQNYNYNNLMKVAEDVLEKQYELSKEIAEKSAEERGQEVECPYFVQQTMTREALGAPKFDDRQIALTMENIKEVLRSGGNIQDLYREGFNTSDDKEEAERPPSVIEMHIDGQKYEMDQKEVEAISIETLSVDLTEEFNESYNRSFDKEFMKSLIERYGHAQVRLILDRMKEVEMRNGSIKNPAGYLTQSLKNNKRDNVNYRSMRSEKGEEL